MSSRFLTANSSINCHMNVATETGNQNLLCCCCVDLRAGIQILAVVYGILNLAAIASFISVLATITLESVYYGN